MVLDNSLVIMTEMRSNIVLIGMPGAGKSTIGVVLAKQTSRGFIDTDLLIQTSQCRTLQEIVDMYGYEALRNIEEDMLLGLSVRNHVIATGGSAVYSELSMHHLRSDGVIVFLDVDLSVLESRIHDFKTRGLAKRPDQSFADLFRERLLLYIKYADITIKCAGLTQKDICTKIMEKTKSC
jgi:shikimate kinase